MAEGNFGGGNGSSISPFLVEDQADLEAISSHSDAYFRQTQNIFCSGTFSTISFFYGFFDGNRKVIANISPSGRGMFNHLYGTITRARFLDASVSSTSEVGIIAGWLRAGGLITYVYARGSVNATSSSIPNAGGLVGYTYSGSSIYRCAADVVVKGAGGHNVGGFVGHHEGAIEECYTIGSMSGEHDVGGLVGDNEPGSSIINCYSRASIYSTGEGSGGLVGDHYPASAGVTNCYSTGRIQGVDGVGGLCGTRSSYPNTGPVSSSYWDTQTSGQSSDYSDAQARNTSQMKQQGNFSGWNFTTVWGISPSINDGYPYLRHVPILGDMQPSEQISIQPPAFRGPFTVRSANPVVTFDTFAPAPTDPLEADGKKWWDISWDKNDPPDWIYPEDEDYEEDGPLFRHEVEGIE